MEPPEALHIIQSRRGQFIKVVWSRSLPLLRKAAGAHVGGVEVTSDTVIVKTTSMVVRAGVEFSHRQAVQLARLAAGREVDERAPLKGKEWLIFPLLKRSLKTGKVLATFTPVEGQHASTVFTVNGVEVGRADLDGIVASKDWKPRSTDKPIVLDVPVENIVSMGA